MYNVGMRLKEVQHNAPKYRDDPTRGASKLEDRLARYVEPVIKFVLPAGVYDALVQTRARTDLRNKNEYREDEAPTSLGPASQNIWFVGYPTKREYMPPWWIVKISLASWFVYTCYALFWYSENLFKMLRRLPGTLWKFKFVQFYNEYLRPYITADALPEGWKQDLTAYDEVSGGWRQGSHYRPRLN